jgi:hypothetical protein
MFNSFFIADVNNNLRLTLDLSSTAQHKTNAKKTVFIQSIGIDSHNIFSGDKGDGATFSG